MNRLFFLFVIFLCFKISAQSNWNIYKRLSCSKKVWVISHPFKAKKALQISKEAKRVADSMKLSPLLDKDPSGGQVDAFRHAYWMARLKEEIGENAARSLGKAHEKENYWTFKKQKLEDGIVPDEVSSIMDLFNNEVGLQLSLTGKKKSKRGLIYKVINAIRQGRLKVIKKDKNGNFLTCSGNKIKPKSLLGKWKNNKCLVSSKKR